MTYKYHFDLLAVDLSTLMGLLEPCAAKWRQIGVHLEFSGGILDNIERTIPLVMEGPKGHLRKLIERWFDQDGSDYLDTLCQALKDVGEDFLANELRLKGIYETIIVTKILVHLNYLSSEYYCSEY